MGRQKKQDKKKGTEEQKGGERMKRSVVPNLMIALLNGVPNGSNCFQNTEQICSKMPGGDSLPYSTLSTYPDKAHILF